MLDRQTAATTDPREALIADEVLSALSDATATLAYLIRSRDNHAVAIDDICMTHVREAYGRARAALDFAHRANALSRAA